MSAWKTMESAPKDGTDILAWDGGKFHLVSYDKGTEAWWVLVEFTVEPTHWMPLPAPPQSSESNAPKETR